MKNLNKFSFTLIVIVALSACEQNNSVGDKAKSETIPNLSVDQLLDMSKNARQELERRCLGNTNKTCLDLNGGTFNNRKESRLKICNYKASLENDNEKRAREQKKCDDLF